MVFDYYSEKDWQRTKRKDTMDSNTMDIIVIEFM